MNIPEVKLGMVAVSRDCFPMDLSRERSRAVLAAYEASGNSFYLATTIVENEKDAMKALEEIRSAGVNALVVYLGNFGPEGPETILAQKFSGPVMFAAAAEENVAVLSSRRGDALCGLLSASYNLKLRHLNVYIPEHPVGTAEEVAEMIEEFIPVSRILLGVKKLKIFTFGPRPQDFFACNAPIQGLYDLGVEIQENSELDLFVAYRDHENDPRIPSVVAEMSAELGAGNRYAGILDRLAALELTLLDWKEQNLGASEYCVFANKCWPAFQTEFKCVPCYVNSRLASRLIPVACEVDVYGALSEYILACATMAPPTILDINNSVPKELYDSEIAPETGYRQGETFMGFHCGNTPSCMIRDPKMSYQLIMKRSLEPDGEPDITRGTLEGDLKPGYVTFFRLHSTADCRLISYVAQGEVLPTATHSFGSIGVIAIPEMERFYRHVLVENGFPHHGGLGFAHVGKTLFSALRLLGVEQIGYNQPSGILYPSENPFA